VFGGRAIHVIHPLNDSGFLAIVLLDLEKSALDIDRNVARLKALLACRRADARWALARVSEKDALKLDVLAVQGNRHLSAESLGCLCTVSSFPLDGTEIVARRQTRPLGKYRFLACREVRLLTDFQG
jgi:hypothetical protein